MSPISDALSGKSNNKVQGFGKNKVQGFGKFQSNDNDSVRLFDKKGKPVHWESAMTKLFTGIAFLIVTIVLGFSAMGTGWWFWLLIPAFSALGAGIAQIIQLQKNEKKMIQGAPPEIRKNLEEEPQAKLSASQPNYVTPDSRYQTGDLVPPSVVEGTTRHLQMDSEGETMNLPRPENRQN